MKKLPIVCAGVLSIALGVGACAKSPSPDAPESAPASAISEDQLSQIVTQVLEPLGISGIAQVTDAAGQVVTAPYGTADEQVLVEAGTNFGYRSITKSFVGTVILQLVEEGQVKLDEPISTYVQGVPGGDAITIKDLGTMRSGLANYSAQPELGTLLEKEPGVAPPIDTLLDMAFAQPVAFAPDAKFQYSNTNTLLLGKVIESVTGKPWDVAVAERIGQPLGMKALAYPDDQPMPPPAARGEQANAEGVMEPLPPVSFGWFGAAGGLVGSVGDLSTWARALGSGELLDPAVQQQRIDMLGPVSEDPASPEYDRYGFAMGELDGWVGHTGTGLGFQGLAMYDPASGTTVAILLNGTGENPDLPAAIFHLIAARLAQ